MTVLEIIQRSAEFLAKKGVESPRLQIELMLAHVLKMPRLQLYLNFERLLSDADVEQLRGMVKRRGNREPLQHVLGSVSFCGLEIEVNKAVLIPRPETEMLAERAWRFLQERTGEASQPVSAADFGTGSGCLAIAMAMNAPAARVTALDVSSDACIVARANVEKHGLRERVAVIQEDGFKSLAGIAPVDLIVSNPPYIPTAEIETLAPEVRDHDPRLALDGGADGLDFYRRLTLEARGKLLPYGKIMVEFGDDQAQALTELFSQAGWKVEAVESDLSKRPRILIAQAVA